MCLILFAHQVHPSFPLILAANRDEFHARPTAPLGEWTDSPGVFGGRDLKAGGSWLAISRAGRWAAVTNYRDPTELSRAPGPSRGGLVAGFVTDDRAPAAYLADLLPRADAYAGFNLLLGDGSACFWTSNRANPPEARSLPPGIYGVSNHLLDTPWPKVERGKRALEGLVRAPLPSPDDLLEVLLDRALAADHQLPATGVPLELERALSAAFISTTRGYGTRCSTAVLIRRGGGILIAERRFGPDAEPTGETRLEI